MASASRELVPVQGRQIILLQYPPKRPGIQLEDAVDGFKWVDQYLHVDQVPESSRDLDTPYRIRLYDQRPTQPKQFNIYRVSFSIGDDLQIAVFPSLDVLFATMTEWRPRPLPNSDVMRNSHLALAVTTRGRRWIFSIKSETELLEVLDLFRSIAPVSCASADKLTREKDDIIDDVPLNVEIPDEHTSNSPPKMAENHDSNPKITISASEESTTFLTSAASTTKAQKNHTRSPSILPQNLDDTFTAPAVDVISPIPHTLAHDLHDNTPKNDNAPLSPSSLLDSVRADHFNTPSRFSDDTHSTHNSPYHTQFNSMPSLPHAGPSAGSHPNIHSESFPDEPLDSFPRSYSTLDSPVAGNTTLQNNELSNSTSSANQHVAPNPQPAIVTNNQDDLQFLTIQSPEIVVHNSGLVQNDTIIKFQRTFNLPLDQLLYHTQCSFIKSIPLHGRLYISDKHLTFYSSIFGYRTKLQCEIRSILQCEPATLVGGLKVTLRKVGGNGSDNVQFITEGDTSEKNQHTTAGDDSATTTTTLLFGSLTADTKQRIIDTLERVNPAINAELREKNAKLESERLEKEKKDRLKAEAIAKKNQESIQHVEKNEASREKNEKVDDQSPDNDDDDDDKIAPQKQCNLPMYGSYSFEGGPSIPIPANYIGLYTSGGDFDEIEAKKLTKINLSQLWHLFLSNYAKYSYHDFHHDIRKDQNIRLSKWEKLEKVQPIGLSEGNEKTNPFYGATEMMIRQVGVNCELNAPMAPPRADIYKQQIVALWRKNKKVEKIALIGLSSTPEAPFGDSFNVAEHFIFTEEVGGVNMSIHLGALFTKPIGWKMKMIVGILKARVKSDGLGQHIQWADEVTKYLQQNGTNWPEYNNMSDFSLYHDLDQKSDKKKDKKLENNSNTDKNQHPTVLPVLPQHNVSTIVDKPSVTFKQTPLDGFLLPASLAVIVLLITLSTFILPTGLNSNAFDRGMTMSILFLLLVIITKIDGIGMGK